MTVLAIILTLVIAAVLYYVVKSAPPPFVEPMKSWIAWIIVAAAIIYILMHTIGGGNFLNQRVGS